MVLPDYPPPSRDGNERSSLYKSRYISLQSRVDSLAAESMYESNRDSVPEIPSMYLGPGRSTSYILEPGYQRSSQPESMVDDDKLPPSNETKAHEELRISTFREVLFIGVVVVSHLMTQAALGQALAPIHIIAQSFQVTNPGQEAWFIAGYSLTVGTFILISGRLGDKLGHKRVFVFGYAWLGVWSAFAGFSVYPGRQIFFDVCRAMQGIGPALCLPNALALLGRAYAPGIKKNIVFSLFGAMAPMGFVIGALFGSIFGQLAWWPWAFWSYAITSFALSAFALLVIPKSLGKAAQFAGVVKRPGMDWTGCILGVAGLVLVNVAWNNGPLYGWGAPHVYFILIIGLLCLIAFGYIEARAVSPILPIHAINGTVGYVLACVGVGWGSFGIWVFYSWRWLEEIRHDTPLSVSAQYAPAVLCGLIAAGFTGFMLTHTPVSFVMMIAMFAFMVGHVIAGTMPAHQVYWAQFFFSIIIMPFGMDMSFPAATVILSNHMPREHQGLAASLVNTVVNYSISIALGIAGTVETSVNHRSSNPADIERGIRAAYYTGIALSVSGVVLGGVFFARTMLKEGWKIMDH
ncbi:hypothetical protein B0A49_09529 [Cryomyces minteri]|uniref:Major facilitator superfamily (MFS) profile domain-containing protein n=1 Tax=Cryomyces minteri TaxID=331657 RepID=A0A4U0WTH9_9PEZI|nr:hypothetical protein B0A49_09529 [Cryomyces minteri]